MSCLGMSLRINDKVSYSGKLCKVIKNHNSGLYRLEQIDGVFEFEVYADEIESLYTRQCLDCRNDVMPDAKRGRCADCLAESEAA